MYNLLVKRGDTIAFVVGIVISLIFILIAFSGLDEFNGLSKAGQKATNIFNFGLYAAIALAIIAGIVWVLFGLFQLVTNLKGSMKFLIAFGLVLVLFFVFYSMADPGMTGILQGTLEKFDITENNSKMISAALSTGITMGIVAAASFIIFELINIFK